MNYISTNDEIAGIWNTVEKIVLKECKEEIKFTVGNSTLEVILHETLFRFISNDVCSLIRQHS